MKENRVVILARAETTDGVDSIQAAIAANAADPANNPHPFQTDAILCAELDVGTDADVLERGNYNPSLSNEETGIGRMLQRFSFRTELRSSGVLGIAPRIGRLFKACGMSETNIPAGAASQISNPVAGPTSISAGIQSIIAGLTKTAAPTANFDTYRLTATTGGANGAAAFLVTSAGFPEGDATIMDSPNHTAVTNSVAGVVTIGGTTAAPTFTLSGTWAVNEFVELFVGGIRFYAQFNTGDTPAIVAARLRAAIILDARFATSTVAAATITIALSAAAGPKATTAAGTTAITLGTSSAVITIPNFTGNVTAGDSFEVTLRRVGVRYDPVSDDTTSLTIWAFLDGSLYRLRGSRGTWAAAGAAAAYATVTWTFTGIYVDPIDYALPTSLAYEESKPFKVEVAELALHGLSQAITCASRFAMDMANEVVPLDCINADEAYKAIQITGRTPTAGTDPDAKKPSIWNPWTRMRRGDTTRIHVAVGRKGGAANTVRLQADRANYTGAGWANRNRIRAHDIGLRLARKSALGDDELFVHFG